MIYLILGFCLVYIVIYLWEGLGGGGVLVLCDRLLLLGVVVIFDWLLRIMNYYSCFYGNCKDLGYFFWNYLFF